MALAWAASEVHHNKRITMCYHGNTFQVWGRLVETITPDKPATYAFQQHPFGETRELGEITSEAARELVEVFYSMEQTRTFRFEDARQARFNKKEDDIWEAKLEHWLENHRYDEP